MVYTNHTATSSGLLLLLLRDNLESNESFVFEVNAKQLEYILSENIAVGATSFEDLDQLPPGTRRKVWYSVSVSQEVCIEKLSNNLYMIGSRFM